MKTYEIHEGERQRYYEGLSYLGGFTNIDEKMKDWVKGKLAKAGFDLSQPFSEELDRRKQVRIYTQE